VPPAFVILGAASGVCEPVAIALLVIASAVAIAMRLRR
jgi:hypothetical protein